MLLLADRRVFFVKVADGAWSETNQYGRWGASPSTLTFRKPLQVPDSSTLQKWSYILRSLLSGENRTVCEIDRFNNDEIEYHYSITMTAMYRRSTSPELLRVFEKMAAGESP